MNYKKFGSAFTVLGISPVVFSWLEMLDMVGTESVLDTGLVLNTLAFNGIFIAWLGIGMYNRQIRFTDEFPTGSQKALVTLTYVAAGFTVLVALSVTIVFLIL